MMMEGQHHGHGVFEDLWGQVALVAAVGLVLLALAWGYAW
jgi:hypothetical protein